jgi:hypothetical protein
MTDHRDIFWLQMLNIRLFLCKTMYYRLLSSEGWGGRHGKGRLSARELLAPNPPPHSTPFSPPKKP